MTSNSKFNTKFNTAEVTGMLKIIEATMLMRRMDNGEDVKREFDAALSRLTSQQISMVLMMGKLLDGKPYQITSGNADNIRLCITLAQMIGATVEDGVFRFADALPPGLRSIRINPPSQAKQ
jgi:hypothetical protein